MAEAAEPRLPPSPHVGRVPGVVRSTAAMVRDPLEFLTRISKEHGDVVRFRLLGREVYLFNHPDAIDDLVIGHKDLLVKDWLTRELSLVVGKGLLTSEGAPGRAPVSHRSQGPIEPRTGARGGSGNSSASRTAR